MTPLPFTAKDDFDTQLIRRKRALQSILKQAKCDEQADVNELISLWFVTDCFLMLLS